MTVFQSGYALAYSFGAYKAVRLCSRCGRATCECCIHEMAPGTCVLSHAMSAGLARRFTEAIQRGEY